MTTAHVEDGYKAIRLHPNSPSRKHSGGSWRPPIHMTYVYVAEDGTPLATIRTLGMMMPKKNQRLSVKVPGVMFHRFVGLLGHDTWSDICPYTRLKDAKAAVETLIAQLRNLEP